MAITIPGIGGGAFTSAASSIAGANFSNSVSTQAGDIIAVAIYYQNTGGNISSITATGGSPGSATDSGKGTVDDGFTGNKNAIQALLTPGTGITSLTVNFSGTPGFGGFLAFVIRGFTTGAFDKVAQAANNGPAPSSGPTGTLSSANEAVVGFGCTAASLNPPGAPWTSDGVDANGSCFAHQIVSATTSLSFDPTPTTDFSAWIATFQDGGAPPPPPPPLMGQIWL